MTTAAGLPAEAAPSFARGVALAAVFAPIAPAASVAVALLAVARAHLQRLRRASDAQHAVLRALPDVVDHLLLCTGAGLSLALAHPEVARAAPLAVGRALLDADHATAAGTPRADALERALQPLGPRAGSLGATLADHLRYGTPLAPALDRLRLELRLERQRVAEIEARRVPVRLLGPLVLCTLPAFALLTVVPLLAASLRALPA